MLYLVQPLDVDYYWVAEQAVPYLGLVGRLARGFDVPLFDRQTLVMPLPLPVPRLRLEGQNRPKSSDPGCYGTGRIDLSFCQYYATVLERESCSGYPPEIHAPSCKPTQRNH